MAVLILIAGLAVGCVNQPQMGIPVPCPPTERDRVFGERYDGPPAAKLKIEREVIFGDKSQPPVPEVR